MEKLSSSLLRIIRKIPFFAGLAPAELTTLLRLCKQMSYNAEEVLCKADEPSRDLFILLSGAVEVSTSDGVDIARVRPVSTIGEMGFITGWARSATVKASVNSTVLRIERADWDAVLKQHPKMKLRLYENLIGLLSDKIIAGNLSAHDLAIHSERYQGRIEELERIHLRAQQILIERCGLSEEEVKALLEEQPAVPI